MRLRRLFAFFSRSRNWHVSQCVSFDSASYDLRQELLQDFESNVSLLSDLLKRQSSLLHVEDDAYVLRSKACNLPKYLFDFFYGKLSQFGNLFCECPSFASI
jgi:hypothetical protein